MSQPASRHLLEHWVASLAVHVPFSHMDKWQLEQLASAATERYFPPDATVLAPSADVPTHLIFLRQGRLIGRRAGRTQSDDVFELDAGSLLPVAALLAQRPVTGTYTALGDCFCLFIAWSVARELMDASAVWADFLNQRMLAFLETSRQRWRHELQAQRQQRQNLETLLADLPVREPVTQAASAPLREVLGLMQARQIGSVLLTDEGGALAGILTRNDVLGRVTLAGVSLDEPAASVMSQPVRTIGVERTAFDAALMMSQHHLRHLPVLSDGRLHSIISERDLFALQNHSIKHVSAAIFEARGLPQLQRAAEQIRDFAAHLMAQGLQSRSLTGLISQLNDRLAQRVIELELVRHELSERQMCWLALGSEGRSEQTIATDQDNALIYESDDPARDQPRWLAWAADVNRVLDACGYPLCTGGVMASNPACCLTLAQWRQRFAHWIEQGSPQDLLKASVFFDFRALAGRADWLGDLGVQVRHQAMQTPRFIQQWVHNHLRMSVPLNWHGGLQTQRQGDREVIDIKLSGTAIVVDAARILAFAQGIEATSTTERLERASARLGIPEDEYRGWITAFDYLQSLRLRQQLRPGSSHANANCLTIDALDQVDKRILKVSFAAIRTLQQRLSLDYVR
jgi:CBS domain-containing protein